jgi:hypothetical protein
VSARPFQKRKGAVAGVVWCKRAAALSRLRPEEEKSRAGQAGLAERPRPSGEGGPVGGGREVAVAMLKTGAGPKFKK